MAGRPGSQASYSLCTGGIRLGVAKQSAQVRSLTSALPVLKGAPGLGSHGRVVLAGRRLVNTGCWAPFRVRDLEWAPVLSDMDVAGPSAPSAKVSAA